MKIAALFFLSFTLCTTYAQTYVPDDDFEQALIDLGYDSGPLDDYVPTANINTVTILNLWNNYIYDLTGIEDFTALQNLECGANYLTSLDVSQNSALTSLKCRGNDLTILDVSQNTALLYLDCQDNNIASLDLSNNIALTYLDCNLNQMNVLNISQNVALEQLYCNINHLTSLDLSLLNALTDLNCFANNLTNVDVSQNINLTFLSVAYNQLTTIDISNNTALSSLNCYHNQLTNLDVSQNLALTVLSCSENLISNLDVNNNTNLTTLYTHYNQITNLDLSLNTTLVDIRCNDNQLTALNVKNGNNTNITGFNTLNNPNLICIEVDDEAWSTTNWMNIDPQTNFSEGCALGNGDFTALEMSLFPNPTSEVITISSLGNALLKYSIADMRGRIIVSEKTLTNQTISVSNLRSGLYFIRLQNKNDEITNLKFLKK